LRGSKRYLPEPAAFRLARVNSMEQNDYAPFRLQRGSRHLLCVIPPDQTTAGRRRQVIQLSTGTDRRTLNKYLG
jgi:hypothetical protein